jgi:hypothetical protein
LSLRDTRPIFSILKFKKKGPLSRNGIFEPFWAFITLFSPILLQIMKTENIFFAKPDVYIAFRHVYIAKPDVYIANPNVYIENPDVYIEFRNVYIENRNVYIENADVYIEFGNGGFSMGRWLYFDFFWSYLKHFSKK